MELRREAVTFSCRLFTSETRLAVLTAAPNEVLTALGRPVALCTMSARAVALWTSFPRRGAGLHWAIHTSCLQPRPAEAGGAVGIQRGVTPAAGSECHESPRPPPHTTPLAPACSSHSAVCFAPGRSAADLHLVPHWPSARLRTRPRPLPLGAHSFTLSPSFPSITSVTKTQGGQGRCRAKLGAGSRAEEDSCAPHELPPESSFPRPAPGRGASLRSHMLLESVGLHRSGLPGQLWDLPSPAPPHLTIHVSLGPPPAGQAVWKKVNMPTSHGKIISKFHIRKEGESALYFTL